MHPGDAVLRADGSWARVAAVERYSSAGARVYNMTVGTAHTYYAGAEPVLVHNAGACPRAPDFIAPESGPAIVVPRGASGPTPPASGTGMIYSGGSGGHGLDERVTRVRIMDEGKGHKRRLSYGNASDQKVDPYTGRTISKKNPWAHEGW